MVRPFSSNERGGVEAALAARRGTVKRMLVNIPLDWLVGKSIDEVVEDVLTRGDRPGSPHPFARPAEVRAQLLPLEQLEPQVEDRWADSASGAARITCWTWDLPFQVDGPPDLIGRTTEGSVLSVYEPAPITPPPAITWSWSGDRLIAKCWVQASPDGDPLDPPMELFQEAAEAVRVWADEVNSTVTAWRQEVAEAVRRTVEEKHEQAHRAAARVAELNALLGAAHVGDLDPTHAAPPDQAQELAAPLDLPRLLTDANVEDIVKVINRWAQAIEDDQGPFQKLAEPEHSALLVATLRGAFGRAAREVFSGKGKLDFQVTADALQEHGLAIAYGGELKVWQGEVGLLDAVAQELDNCTASTSDGCLIVIVRDRASFTFARDTGVAALNDRFESLPPVAGQRAYRVPRPADQAHMVRLVVIFVDETRTEGHLAKPTAT